MVHLVRAGGAQALLVAALQVVRDPLADHGGVGRLVQCRCGMTELSRQKLPARIRLDGARRWGMRHAFRNPRLLFDGASGAIELGGARAIVGQDSLEIAVAPLRSEVSVVLLARV